MNRYSLAIPVLLSLTIYAPATTAQTRIDTSFSNLRYTVADLLPSDGIAPQVQFGQTAPSPDMGGMVLIYPSEADGHDVILYDSKTGVDARDFTFRWEDNVKISSTFDPGTGFEQYQGTLSLDVIPPGTNAFVTSGQFFSPYQSFQLAPYSSLTVSVDFTMSLASNPTEDVTQGGQALVRLQGIVRGTYQYWDEEVVYVGVDPAGTEWADSTQARTTSVTFSNESGDWLGGEFYVYMGDQAKVVLLPIPEPSTWAMWLLGCTVLGAAGLVRRRTGQYRLTYR